MAATLTHLPHHFFPLQPPWRQHLLDATGLPPLPISPWYRWRWEPPSEEDIQAEGQVEGDDALGLPMMRIDLGLS